MFASHPVVHPMEVAAPAPNPGQQPAGAANLVQQPPGVLMKDLPGMPGTPSGLALRVTQLLLAAVSLASMSSTSDFADVTAFCYIIAAAILQCVWSLSVGHCGHICTACYTVFTKPPACYFLFHWRRDHSHDNLLWSMRRGRNHCLDR